MKKKKGLSEKNAEWLKEKTELSYYCGPGPTKKTKKTRK